MITCASCIYMKRLRGVSDTRWGCVVALYAWHRRNVPEELAQADVVDVRELVRRGETTRHWIEVALRMEEGTQACPWWEVWIKQKSNRRGGLRRFERD